MSAKSRDLSSKESRIKKLAKVAFNKALAEFYYPPLSEPNFVFDYTHFEGFYIDPENQWEISMNLANTPLFNDDQEYIDSFHIVSLHEVSHYQIIPYDGLINAKLLRAAMENVIEVQLDCQSSQAFSLSPQSSRRQLLYTSTSTGRFLTIRKAC